jgi:asparagine synthase (glutamine-hydrolysing)
MCGIAGELRFDGRAADASAVAAATAILAPRGPDGSGLWSQGPVAFGHRRLKIIDLSDRAQQPMVDPELGLALVFNGCIYNHADLRKELETKGYRFFSDGDTEVVLKAFHAWGRSCVERFHGMFAFALWERDSGRVTLARDRLGVKPLYLAEGPSRLRFASTLPALLAAGEVDTALDPVALHHYLNFHAVVPPPRTILKGVRKLPPATVLTVHPDGRREPWTYWDLPFGPDDDERDLAPESWAERVLAALRTAVRRRLVADVPVGVLLSGGLDSSLIVGLLAEAGQQHLATFSVGFEAVGGEAGDEFRYSDVIAREYDTDHHRIRVDSRERLVPSLPDCIRAMAEPMVSHDAIGFFLLSEEVSRHIKVVQSGQGADEVFGGYHWYPPMLTSTDPAADYAARFCDTDDAEYRRTVHPRLHVKGSPARSFIAEHFGTPGAERPVDKALRIDTRIMLVDDPVKRVDNMTMAFGLEARVPFLDHELVELAARVPGELKVAHGGKHVLKEAARKVIPAAVIDRPKGYFPVPALKYLRGEVLDMVRGALAGPRARERELFNPEYVDGLLARPDDHITPLGGSRTWQLAVLELWLEAHGI